MHIGVLKSKEDFTFTHMNSDVKFEPSTNSDGVFGWTWKELLDTGIDISFDLEKSAYIGSVSFKASASSIAGAKILVDEKAAGLREAHEGCLLGGDISIPVGVYGNRITIRIYADFMDVSISDIEILGAAEDETPVIWPSPKSIEPCGKRVKIANVIAASDDVDELFSAEFLRETLSERLGEWRSEDGITIILKKCDYVGERYTVKHSENTVTVSAAKRISLLYGTDAIASLADNDGLFVADVDDSPATKLRGFHFGLPHRDKIEFTRKLLRYVLLPMRYNVIFLEFAGGMRFDRHPEISEAWLQAATDAKAGKQPFMPHSDKVSRWSLLEKDDVRLLVSYIKELGFALIPEVQSLAHVQYITYAHPEIAELDETVVEVDVRSGADARPENFYAHSYCPSHPNTYKIIFDIIDEIIEVAEPDGYVHIGHDEVYEIGLCERCKGKDPSDLFSEHVTTLYNYLKERGYKTMMWSDMIHPAPVTNYLTYRAKDTLPRDIVMLDFIWYFHRDKDIEDDLLPLGYKVAVGNLYSSHYPRFNKRIMKDGMIGGEVSSWLITDEDILGRNGKLWDIMYLSEMLWNVDGYDERNRKAFTHIIAKHIQPKARDLIREKLSPKGYSAEPLSVSGLVAQIPRELSALCPKACLGDGAKISISGRYDRLVFEHTTINPAPRVISRDLTEGVVTVGKYVITYNDGTSQDVDIIYDSSVNCYKSGYATPKPQEYYRHFGYVATWFSDPAYEGKTERGEDLTVLGYVWENPYPEKKITNIKYESAADDYCRLAIAGVKGLKKI